ncbi:STAS domain-containing protein [Dactylosporangium aurantiacum]|uniref:STAS domain-containing protein n=1 Tax=Dactylosporangium aurantiacum TaxID=35754 RepID=A0A9Q9I8G9_9ACTN|nr:STAS domain-containing protein [Dactylosporangium aurantiacum]MDG6108713.1 STAS domain-containing protein [Dactylosporangium aurantiacum]UWZ51076.1 STAS domain-containing protein [Dactylosporangium aurantiacum]
MTALLSLDNKNFSLACDSCGQLVTNLAPTMGDWAVAWSLFSQDGWTGDDLATGPHTCGRCAPTSRPPRMIEQALTRERTTPVARESRRLTIGQVADVTVVTLWGNPDLLVNARLRDVVLDLPAGARRLVVDVSRVARLDSGALDVLVEAHRRPVTVCLVGPTQQVRDALRLLTLHELFPTYQTVAEATCCRTATGPTPPPAAVHRDERVEVR